MEQRSVSDGLPVERFYNKTSITREFQEYGVMSLGESCPISTSGQEAEDNKFIANLAFEMPPQGAIEEYRK